MKSNSSHKILSVIALSLFLTACGGGGGSESTNGGGNNGGGNNGGGNNGGGNNGGGSVAAPVITLSASALTVNESSSGNFTFTTTGGSGSVSVQANVSSGHPLAITVDGNKITVPVADLQNDEASTVTVTATDTANKSSSAMISLTLKNTSVEPIVTEISAYGSMSGALALQTEETKVLSQLLKLATFVASAQVSPSEAASILASVEKSSVDKDAFLKIVNADAVTAYSSKGITESQLKAELDKVKLAHQNYAAVILSEINRVAGIVGVKPVTTAQSVYNKDNKTISFLVGNSSLGQYVNGAWVYNSEYDYLTQLTTDSTCTF